MTIPDIRRLVRTAGRLRASQWLWRGRYLMERHLSRAGLNWRAAPARWNGAAIAARRGGFPDIPVFHRPGPIGEAAVAALGRGELTHLNRTVQLGRDKPAWPVGEVSTGRLWAVTLHGHYWVYDLAEAAHYGCAGAPALLERYIDDWLARCSLRRTGCANLVWNSYAVATRLGWWVRALCLLGAQQPEPHRPLVSKMLESIAQQAEFLSRHIEWDLRGNHLLRDAVGLAWAGRFFRGGRAERWLAQATKLAVGQADEQILSDGGHFERSPMYHLHVMEDLLTLAMLLRDPPARQKMRGAWRAMAEHLAWMRHPDGGIPLLNDAAQHAACGPDRMLQLAGRISVAVDPRRRTGGRHLHETGLAVWQGHPWTVFFDVGPVGPDCQPGHAHADTLSVQCSFDADRLFVDPGTFGYDNDRVRRYDRSTASHNTVCIDEQDSSEVWHVFRVGARARPVGVSVQLDGGSMIARAAHDGYDRLPGSPRHVRQLSVHNGGALQIRDGVSGRGEHRVRGGYLLAPAWSITPRGSGWRLVQGGKRVRVTVRSRRAIHLAVETRVVHPQFGLELPTHRLTWDWEGPLPLEVTTVVERD